MPGPKEPGHPVDGGDGALGLENAHVCILSMMQPRRFSSPAVDKQLTYAFWDRYGFYQMGEMLKEIFPRHADKMAQVENMVKTIQWPTRLLARSC